MLTADQHHDPRHIMRYYIQDFTTLLTTNLENNFFLSVFLPLALESPLVKDALLAWASSHLALRNESYKRTAMIRRAMALAEFRKSIATGSHSPEINLATSLIFCSLSSISADSEWMIHLSGAMAIIRGVEADNDEKHGALLSSYPDIPIRIPQFFECSNERAWLLRNFAYHDVMMAVAQDRMPMYTSKAFLTGELPLQVDPYYGLASPVLVSLLDICQLNVVLQNECISGFTVVDTEHSHYGDIVQRAYSISADLRHWSVPSHPDAAIVNHAEAYRAAAIIYLFWILRRHRLEIRVNYTKEIQSNVAAIIAVVNAMPSGCLPECTMLFPLFIAGSEATGSDHIRDIDSKMRQLYQRRKFGNIATALKVLEALWAQRENEHPTMNTPVDWLEIVRQEGITLSLS